MTAGILGTWYDLPEAGAPDYLVWAHSTYLPWLQAQPGVQWVAHYRYAGGGAQMDKVKSTIVSHTRDEVGQGSQYLVLAGAADVHAFFLPAFDESALPKGFAARLAQREGVRTAALTLEASVDGPSRATQGSIDSAPSPGIQLGTLRPVSMEAEFDLIRWYAQYRMPSMAVMPGVVRTRKWAGVAGWPKHGILYEFESLAHRLEHFEKPHESLALEPGHWTNRITRASHHAPGSPFIGQRIWPAV
ncbi:MAG: hypothetical protein JWP27_3091 [Flaviaesturariibacter sp.]|nr:hypothetical protein [Flaviaesturariibacter sp.]